MASSIFKRAAHIMDISEQEAQNNSRNIPELKAVYFRKPVKGGVQVIIGKDGGVLLAPFIVKPEQMIEDYKAGKRSA